MTTQINQAFVAHLTVKGNNTIVHYAKGLELTMTSKLVAQVNDGVHQFADVVGKAEDALNSLFKEVVAIAKKHGLSRKDSGKMIATILGVPTISKCVADEKIANQIRMKWQFQARDLPAPTQVKSDKESEAGSNAPTVESFEELLTNKKLLAVGERLSTRVKDTSELLALIQGLLSDSTAEQILAISDTLAKSVAKPAPTQKAPRTRKPKAVTPPQLDFVS